MATVITNHLTNGAYGFPRGAVRRATPVALACIHITGNSSTAGMFDVRQAAQNEKTYANRPGSNGPSAHYYIARDGWAIEAIDPTKYAAWSNGDVSKPHTTNPGVARVLAMFQTAGHNPNEAYWLEIENVGSNALPITASQIQTMASLIAKMSIASGLPINRTTVHGHWEINGIDRQSCPNPLARHETFLNLIISAAQGLRSPTLPGKEAGVTVVIIEKFPTPRKFIGAVLPLQRYSATAEVSPILTPNYSATVDGDVVFEGNTSAPTGSGFLRLASGGSKGFFIKAAQVQVEAP